MPNSAIHETAAPPLDQRRPRLLIDPYICFGPGAEVHTPALMAIARLAGELGMAACVEGPAWDDALQDPDVRRREVDLEAFQPLLRLPALALPTARDLATRFQPARGEADVADLKLLGALHARLVEIVVASDGRLHRLALRSGLGPRVLTPADALGWLESLSGERRPPVVREFDPATALADPALARLIAEECEPFDPYLPMQLATGHGRVLAALEAGSAVALAVLGTSADGARLEIQALTSTEAARGHAVLEPLATAAISEARRRRLPLVAMLGPHDDVALALLEGLGFERTGRDRHGRELLGRLPGDSAPRPAPAGHAWMVSLDAGAHDRLLPELAGASQSELFAAASTRAETTLGSAVLKQLLLPTSSREPAPGDLLLTWHAREPGRAASGCLTAVMRVERTHQLLSLAEALPLTARRPGLTLAELQAHLATGGVTLVDLCSIGRLERLLPLPWLRDQGIVGSTPAGLRRLGAEAFARLAPRLKLS